MTRVLGSSAQYEIRSLPETSALLPTETNDEMPRLSASTWSRIARPSAPLCVSMATLPGGGQLSAKVAFSDTAGSVLSTPRSEEHTSELQSRLHLVCRLLLEKKKEVHFALPVPQARLLVAL